MALLIPVSAPCDRIILKDGSIEISDRVWESEKYVHFILEGTKTVEVRYAKEIVAHIEREGAKVTVVPTPPEKDDIATEHPQKRTELPKEVPSLLSTKVSRKEPPTFSREKKTPDGIDPKMLAGIRNTSFYDPHRQKRYWAFPNSRHTTLKEAVDALAKFYGRSAEWIEANMGNENDLGVIHAKLMAAKDGDEPKQTADRNGDSSAGVGPVFYDNSRPYAYQTNEKRFFHTRDEALADLSRQYGRSEQWIVDHMGATNALRDIHGNLNKSLAASSQQPVTMRSSADWKPLEMPDDLQFYDPRREKKYWAGNQDRYDTYEEAAAALSREYGVPVKWIESNMGDTNRLKEIHQNIRNSLPGQ